VPEQLTFLEEIDDAPPVQELHRAPADDVEEPGRLTGSTEDRRARGEVADLDGLGDPGEIVRGQTVERGVPSQEGLDLHHLREYGVPPRSRPEVTSERWRRSRTAEAPEL
jgi:hypothetical protein